MLCHAIQQVGVLTMHISLLAGDVRGRLYEVWSRDWTNCRHMVPAKLGRRLGAKRDVSQLMLGLRAWLHFLQHSHPVFGGCSTPSKTGCVHTLRLGSICCAGVLHAQWQPTASPLVRHCLSSWQGMCRGSVVCITTPRPHLHDNPIPPCPSLPYPKKA